MIVGPEGSEERARLVDVLRASPDLHDVRKILTPEAALPDGHPAAGKGMQDGKPAAYICQGQSCSLPITDPDAFSAALTGRRDA